jgi:hypothetical protein
MVLFTMEDFACFYFPEVKCKSLPREECAKILAISRSTVLAYLDKGKLLNNKLIFSSTVLSKEELSR